MQIVYEEQFRSQLQEILAFIAKDNPAAARNVEIPHRINPRRSPSLQKIPLF